MVKICLLCNFFLIEITDQKEIDSLFETRMMEEGSMETEWILFILTVQSLHREQAGHV